MPLCVMQSELLFLCIGSQAAHVCLLVHESPSLPSNIQVLDNKQMQGLRFAYILLRLHCFVCAHSPLYSIVTSTREITSYSRLFVC